MIRLGIDEAGRGCVLGDLFVAAYWTRASDADLVGAGAADSKRLNPARRQRARDRLQALGSYRVVRITPRAIDAGNLNVLEEAAIVDLIRFANPDRVTLDALGHPSTLPATRARLLDCLGSSVDLRIEPKADGRYPVVGAASVFAKTERDHALDELKAAHGALGSGYPSDPTTRAWLQGFATTGAPWPPFVRTRWQTVRDLGSAPR